MTGYETRGIGGEKNRSARQLFDLTESPHRRAHQELPAALGSIEQSRIQVCAQYPRNERVDADSRSRPFDRQRFGERSNGGLAGTVRGDLKKAHKRGQRAYVDDATVALFDHMAAKYAAGTQGSVQVCFHNRLPISLWNIQRGHSLRAAGAVHENLDAAELSAYRFEEPLEAGVVGDIGRLGKRPPPERRNFCGCGSYQFLATAGGHDIRPRLGQSSIE